MPFDTSLDVLEKEDYCKESSGNGLEHHAACSGVDVHNCFLLDINELPVSRSKLNQYPFPSQNVFFLFLFYSCLKKIFSEYETRMHDVLIAEELISGYIILM